MVIEYEEEYFNGKGYYNYGNFPQHQVRAEKLINIAKPKSVLDVGCAFGYIVMYLVFFGIPAMGCDISKYAQQKAKEIIPDRFVLCPAWDLKFPDKCFDLIYCEGVLEHIPEDKIEKVFSEFVRVADRYYLQISFSNHKDVEKEYGHVLLKDHNWWFNRMPLNSWLAYGESGTESNFMWLYKG